MFSTLPAHTYHYHNQQPQFYTPHVPSPLSSSPLRRSPSSSPLQNRDANIMPESPSKPSLKTPTSDKMNAKLISPPPTIGGSGSGSKFSKRASKPNPLMGKGSGDEGRETRRKLFLKKVREESDEKRWQRRMSGEGNAVGEEELLRSLWVGEERRRQERRKREAVIMGLGDVIDEEEIGGMGSLDEVMADEVARDEEAELEALLVLNQDQSLQVEYELPEIFERNSSPRQNDDRPETETLYGSDDEEYDNIFMDFVQSESRTASQQPLPLPEYMDQDMMDMS